MNTAFSIFGVVFMYALLNALATVIVFGIVGADKNIGLPGLGKLCVAMTLFILALIWAVVSSAKTK